MDWREEGDKKKKKTKGTQQFQVWG
jgi:hypothetical protein